MPRCIICDYDSETPSIFNDSLTDGNRPRRFVTDRHGEAVCTVCSGEITSTISEDYVDDHGERMWNKWGQTANEE